MSHDCKECGVREEGNWMQSVAERLAKLSLCHSCDFWLSKVGVADQPNIARIDGIHYTIGKEVSGDKGFRGFGGAKHVIKFTDGREVASTNLWCQGHIPERFKARLPDNAEFASPGASEWSA